MLKELSHFQNLGTPNIHFEILTALNDQEGTIWNENDLKILFHNRVVDGRSVFDGCVPLLLHLNIACKEVDKSIKLDETFIDFLRNQTLMKDRFIERLLISLQDDSIFHNIFCSEFISWDIIYNTLQMDNAAFPLKYASFKQLLIDFNVISEHPTKEFNRFVINGRYKKIFDKVVLPEIRKRKIGIDELIRSLEQKRINGEEAEKFVLEYEASRLNFSKEVDWVAEYSAAEGYDIASYESEKSESHDRFIEVKSYVGTPYFYWSRNEIEVARIRKSKYFIYLIDRRMVDKEGYIPLIIQNPYLNLIETDNTQWDDTIDKIRFDFIG